MNELLQQITQHANVSPDQANTGVQMVGGFLKDKLPGGLGGQIEGFLGTQTISTPATAQATNLDQLSGAIAQHLGVPEGSAKTIIQLAGNFLADRLPGPIGAQAKALLGTGGQGDIMGQAKDMLGGLFGH